jgi:hypothetical protein
LTAHEANEYALVRSYVRMHDLHLSIFGSHVPNTTGADVALTRIAYAVYAYHSLTLWSRFADV